MEIFFILFALSGLITLIALAYQVYKASEQDRKYQEHREKQKNLIRIKPRRNHKYKGHYLAQVRKQYYKRSGR